MAEEILGGRGRGLYARSGERPCCAGFLSPAALTKLPSWLASERGTNPMEWWPAAVEGQGLAGGASGSVVACLLRGLPDEQNLLACD